MLCYTDSCIAPLAEGYSEALSAWRFGVKLRYSIRVVSGAPLSSSGLEEALYKWSEWMNELMNEFRVAIGVLSFGMTSPSWSILYYGTGLFQISSLPEKVPPNNSLAMLPLSCALLLACTMLETSAHKKAWSAHKCSFQNCVCSYIHIVPNTDECWWNVQKFCVPTDFEKLEGTLLPCWECSHIAYAVRLCNMIQLWNSLVQYCIVFSRECHTYSCSMF